jgi:ribose transport system substrate-binding protein
MSQMGLKKASFSLAAFVALAIALAACGGGSSSSSESTTASTSTSATTEASETGGGAAAKAAESVAPYIGQPSPFPVTEKLNEIPKGATMIFVDSGTPFASLQYELLGAAAKTMGVHVERINAGLSPTTVGPAMDSVVAKKPAAMFAVGIPVELWTKQLKELQEEGVTITATGITGIEKYGVEPVIGQNERYGRLMAAYVIAEMNPKANVALYTTSEIPVLKLTGEEFEEEFTALCPECKLRTIEIPASTIGSTAPNTIVSDLQAHPETEIAVFSADEFQDGLPAARQAAGIEVETLGLAPSPTNLQYLKEGKETAALGYDVTIETWTLLDQAAREVTGQELVGPEAKGLGVLQFLTPKDITFDPAKGWVGYPDFAERFAKLWGVS